MPAQLPKTARAPGPIVQHVIDAAGKPLGRVASQVAGLLQGKHRASYDPRLLAPVEVRVENVRRIVLTGRKASQKRYYKHAGMIGHLKVRTFENVFAKQPTWALRHAIELMLPKNRLRSRRLRQLFLVS